MNAIIIVSKTRMQNNRVCVGGWDATNHCSVRLLNEEGFHETINDCPYNILDLWDIDYQKIQKRPLPHSEDVAVTKRKRLARLKKGFRLVDVLLKYGAHIYEGGIFNVLEGTLLSTDSGSLFVNHDSCPSNSTCFWICDQDIKRVDFNEKIRYNYNNGTTRFGYTIKYVGLEDNPPMIIPKGTLIRLSLAHWWKPEDSEDEERCYLQLSGFYQ